MIKLRTRIVMPLVAVLILMLLFSVPGPLGFTSNTNRVIFAEEGDWIKIISISPSPVPGIDAGYTHRLRVEVSYNLGTSASGIITANAFDDSGSKQAKAVANPIAIQGGQGNTILDMVYAAPWNGVSSIVVAAVLLKDEQTVLKWVASEAIPINPSADRVAFDQGVAAFQSREYDEAVTSFSEAITIAPRVANYWQWRADAYARSSLFSEAIQDYTSALAIAPNYKPSLVNRGVAKMWIGDFKGAVADFDVVVSTSPVDFWTGWAYRARGVSNVALNNRNQAATDLETYLAIFPEAQDQETVKGWITALKN